MCILAMVLMVCAIMSRGEVQVVDSCNTAALADDHDACLNSKEGEVFPDEYCAFCMDGDYNDYCFTTTEADTKPQSTWACWFQVMPGSAASNSTDAESIVDFKKAVRKGLMTKMHG